MTKKWGKTQWPHASESEPVGQPAGLEKIREAINLISTHSAASISGSTLHEALILLESGYAILSPDEK